MKFLALAALALPPVAHPPQAQSDQQAVSLLTSGRWKFNRQTRVFNADGTFISSNGAQGSWKISHGELDLVFLDDTWHRFFLPIDPAGTRGVDFNGLPEILRRFPSTGPP